MTGLPEVWLSDANYFRRLGALLCYYEIMMDSNASSSLTDNLMDVAALDPKNLDNNLAFNVKLTPGADDTREEAVATMAAYVKSYMQQGGMQVQFNVVSSETLKGAMANPENYRNLLVGISGYNAYYVDLNRDIQTELIERAEYQL